MKPDERKKRDGESYYICVECAMRYRAEWPDGHRGTAHPGDCDYCGHRDKMLTAITDWRWPSRANDEDKLQTREQMLRALGEQTREK